MDTYSETFRNGETVVASDPLASATSLAELVDADWLMNPSPESSTQVLFNSFVAYGLPLPQRIVECPSFGLAHSLMTGCDLLASMPEQLLQGEWARDRLTVLPIRERLPAVSVQVVTRRDSPLTPAAAMLLDCLRDSARRKGLR